MDVHSPADTPAPGILNPPLLRTLVVCDIADSTALVERLGDPQAAQLVRKHDRLARALLEQHGGREIDKTDGFLLLFERPIHAVAFALDYQRGLKHLSAAEGVVVRARVGIHMGDVVVWENSPEDVARGAKPTEIEGLAKPMAARLAQLAQPRQILLTGAAASIAHRAHAELGDCTAHVRWRALGRYLFKGLPEAVEVHEVGEESVATFRAPRGSRTAKRILPWWRRPAVLAAEAAMLALAVGVTAWMSTRSEPALAFAARDWVVVGDLQNLTGNSTFDQSVETALRISLEQSRYVNVLPELKVQETLQRMERDPAKTVVDRGVGSEIAMRDGARALVLPTLAEINGKLRVTAEVIDPKSQATVYSLSAEGMGPDAVLPALDKVGQELRGRLGETLASVTKESFPLERVATSNLDALRAYSLGERARVVGDAGNALDFFKEATNLDDQFALAHIAIATILFDANQESAAKNELNLAVRSKDRLSSRDRLLAEAWLAILSSPREGLKKWKLLAEMYPDYFAAQGNYGYFTWIYANRFDEAISAMQRAASTHNAHRVTSDFMLGVFALGQERYGEAEKQFSIAESGGWRRTEFIAPVFAAQRKFAEANLAIERAKPAGIASDDLDTYVIRIAVALDQGLWADAQERLRSAKATAAELGKSQIQRFDEIDASLTALACAQGTPSRETPHREKFSPPEKWQSEESDGSSDVAFNHLWRAYLEARCGDPAHAERILGRMDGSVPDAGYPVLLNMRAVARAEIERARGRADNALKILQATIDGSELYVTHVALMDAYASKGDLPSSIREARWLASHRGRAYAEYNKGWALTPFNVAQSDLALLREAELDFALGQRQDSQKILSAFTRVWPNSKQFPEVARRMQTLQEKLR